MIVQGIPKFISGKLLRGKMLEALSEYTYQHAILLYQGCSDGIVSGCALTTTEDSIILNPGVVRYEGELYLLNKPQLLILLAYCNWCFTIRSLRKPLSRVRLNFASLMVHL